MYVHLYVWFGGMKYTSYIQIIYVITYIPIRLTTTRNVSLERPRFYSNDSSSTVAPTQKTLIHVDEDNISCFVCLLFVIGRLFFGCWWSSEMIGWSCSQGKKYHRNQLENICSLIVFLDENFGIGIFLKVGKIIGHLFSACFNSLVWSSMKITFSGLIFFR